MKRLKNYFIGHYYSLTIFIFVILYNFVIFEGFTAWKMHSVAYTFHLVDFSFGFCTKFLPGAIYNFLFDSTDERFIVLYEAAIFLFFLFIISLLLEKLIKTVDEKQKTTMLFLVMLFATGTSTFTLHIFMLGSLDTYWFYLSVIFLLLLSDKRLYFLIVPLSGIMIIVHYTSLAAFIPFLLLFILYKITITENRSELLYLWIVLVLSAVTALGFTFYFVVFEADNLTYSFAEFLKILNEKKIGCDTSYLATSLYDYDSYGLFNKEFFDSIESPVLYAIAQMGYRVKTTFALRPLMQGVVPFLLNLPVVFLILSYFNKKRKEKNCTKFKLYVLYLISAMYFLIIGVTLFLSTDTGRFVGHSYLLFMALFFYILYNEKDDGLEHIKTLLSRIPKSLITLYCLLYMFLFFEPYT